MEWKEYDEKVVKDICYHCGSTSIKKTFPYFRRMKFNSPNTFWCEVLDDYGFYVANRGKKHVRLVAIAVREDMQHHGIGRKILSRLLLRTSLAGLNLLTLRTSKRENGRFFWLANKAQIVGTKDDDFEMQIGILTSKS